LRAPLRSIHSFSNLLLDESDGKLNEEQREHLERVVSNATRLDKLIQDVLAYSRSTPAAMRPASVDLDRLVRDIIQQYPSLQPPSVEIVIEGHLPKVMANEASLTQCLSNLLGNAVKFVPNGRVPRVNIRAELMGGEARIWIEDNGIGIAPENQARIFNIFERIQSPEEFSGNGIGLSIVKRAIGRMGGKVGVESDLGRGSRFWIKLLLAPNS
jgi:signal transduction histidine kinase